MNNLDFESHIEQVKLLLVEDFIHVIGTVVRGHQVASGLAVNNPFPLGTIEMQLPFFKKKGVNVDSLYLGTINVSISPKKFEVVSPKITMKNIKWSQDHDEETFSLLPCILIVDDSEHHVLIYYPHPETKIGHLKDKSTIEILSDYIVNISYGTRIMLKLNQYEIIIST
jgi:hypothetical protein